MNRLAAQARQDRLDDLLEAVERAAGERAATGVGDRAEQWADRVGTLDVPGQGEPAGRVRETVQGQVEPAEHPGDGQPLAFGPRRLGQRQPGQVAEQADDARPAVAGVGVDRGHAGEGGHDALHRQARVDTGDVPQGPGLEIGDEGRFVGVRHLQQDVPVFARQTEVAIAFAAHRFDRLGPEPPVALREPAHPVDVDGRRVGAEHRRHGREGLRGWRHQAAPSKPRSALARFGPRSSDR